MEDRYQLNYPAIARQIKKARNLAQLTQAELAELVDISTNAVAKLENNLMTVSLSTLVQIANVLHLDFNTLLSATEQPEDTVDDFLHGLIDSLSANEKEFVIHIIQGMKRFEMQSQECVKPYKNAAGE